MSYYSRFYPFIRPYLPKMSWRVAWWSASRAQSRADSAGRTAMGSDHGPARIYRNGESIGVFLGLVIAQGLLSVGQSYVTAWVSQHIMADFRTHVFAHSNDSRCASLPHAEQAKSSRGHERCERDSIDADGDAHRFHQTARDADRGHSLSADHELAIVPLDPAPLAGPRSRRALFRQTAQSSVDHHSRSNRRGDHAN